jgi:hypothetical protein
LIPFSISFASKASISSEIIVLISNFRYQDFNPEKNIDFLQVHFSPEVTLSALEKTVHQVINDY